MHVQTNIQNRRSRMEGISPKTESQFTSNSLLNRVLDRLIGKVVPADVPSPLGKPEFGRSQPSPSPAKSGEVFLGGRTKTRSRFNLGRLVAAVHPNRRKAAQKHFPIILKEAEKQGVKDKNQLAYILATATHESNAGRSMIEDTDGRKYDVGTRRGKILGNTRQGDGKKYKGRGYVQLTGRYNYKKWSKKLGLDLVNNPRQVEDPKIAAKILVKGMMDGEFRGDRRTGKRHKLGNFVGGKKADFLGARKVVNAGSDKPKEIANQARRLRAAMA